MVVHGSILKKIVKREREKKEKERKREEKENDSYLGNKYYLSYNIILTHIFLFLSLLSSWCFWGGRSWWSRSTRRGRRIRRRGLRRGRSGYGAFFWW